MKLNILVWLLLVSLPGSSENMKVHPLSVTNGKDLYAQHCLTCHQEDGSGVPGMFPPLVLSEKITGPADDLIKIIITGLSGPVIVRGETYDQEMPALDYLTDNEISEILTFVRSSWKNKAPAITPKDVARVRALIRKTGK